MICWHIFGCSSSRVSSLQSCKVLSTYHPEWRFQWEWGILGRPTRQWELLQGFLWHDNWWRYLSVFLFFVFKCWVFFIVVYMTRFFFLSIGGWMMVLNVILPSNQSSRWNGTAEQTFRGMRNYGNGKMAITKSAMKQLRAYINFTQIRFHCGKKKEQHSTSERLWTKKVRKWCDISAVKEMRSQTRATPSSVWMVITQDWLRIVRDGHIMVSGDMSAMVLKRIVCTTTQHMWVAGITG